MSVFKKIQNITLEEYLTLLEQMKQAALSDMDSFPEKEKYMGDVQPGSFLGVRLRYRMMRTVCMPIVHRWDRSRLPGCTRISGDL